MNEKTLQDTHRGKNLLLNMRNYTIIILTVALAIILAVSTDTFATPNNIYTVIYAVSFSAIASFGFTYLMIMGEIDLSVGSVYCFSGAFTGLLVMRYDFPLPVAIIIVLIIGAGVGLSIGVLVTFFRLNSMMITLGYMSIFTGLANLTVGQIHKAYAREYRDIADHSIGGINWTIIAMIVAVVVLEFMLHRSAAFRKVFIVGQNIDTAKIYGIKAVKIKLLCFTLSSVCASLGGILAGARVGSPQIETGRGLEFTLVTAAVLGGASLFGGKGSILLTVVGLLFLQMMTNGLNIYGIEPVAQQTFIGILLVIAVFVDTRVNSESFSYRLKGGAGARTKNIVGADSDSTGKEN